MDLQQQPKAGYDWKQDPSPQMSNRQHAGCNIRRLDDSPTLRFISLPYGGSDETVWYGDLTITGAPAHIDDLANECAEHLQALRAHYARPAKAGSDA